MTLPLMRESPPAPAGQNGPAGAGGSAGQNVTACQVWPALLVSQS